MTGHSDHIDVLIVGAGIAGASLAAALAPHRRVLMIEAEDRPGYHATGRSAAFWHESYGGPVVQPLTRASWAMLSDPPADFADAGFLSPRSALTIGRRSETADIDRFVASYDGLNVAMDRLDDAALRTIVPAIRGDWAHGVLETACSDIDVAGLHGAFLRKARRGGAKLTVRAPLLSSHWRQGAWHVETGAGTFTASTIVNAAGAWSDDVARRCGIAPVGITPFRRTVVQLRLNAPVAASLPLVIHVGGDFYFKGAGDGRIWLSPHDEIPDDARDVSPEDYDVALAIDRLEGVVDWPIAAVEHKWAGLRSFAPDRLPVLGCDAANPAFIWCAGQGGFGIQTAPAVADLLADAMLDRASAASSAAISLAPFAPGRF